MDYHAISPISHPAGTGARWLKQGWTQFKQAPLRWCLLALLLVAPNVAARFLPVGGTLAVTMLYPPLLCIFAGIIRTADSTGQISLSAGLAAFAPRWQFALGLGLVSSLLSLMLQLVVASWLSIPYGVMFDQQALVIWFATHGAGHYLLLMLPLMLPAMALTYFAPQEGTLHQRSLLQSLKASFIGTLRNILPLLGLILLAALILVALLLVLIVIVVILVVLAKLGGLNLVGGAWISVLPPVITIIMMVPLMAIGLLTHFHSWKDIFSTAAPQAA
ncbi:hypothetical protein SAMN02745857_02275 [Andreprevotia lacus DSM 23236]|jgi:hypothetical protein|uniref:Uncharacterized protein n=1 Tax=Andreprevotia lacus DSM 23236 TaxID=1121001 RepID=A0A1W1XP69_9NEIS|nr:hypothetical protein [Andreprevotia lacus]SMC25769.1 hypothetical protein SAMN02745857_02275 [Andreprevotia lacus DSM 23236]